MNFKFFLFVILIIGISFSRIKTDDVEVSDSIKGVTGTFSGALTGTTLNTGNGANELYPMDQDQRTTASPTHVLGTFTNGCRAYNNTERGTYIGLFKGIGALPGYPSNYFPVLKTDNSHLYLSVDGRYSGSFGGSDFQLGMNDSSETLKILLHTRGLSFFRGGKVNFDSISFSSGSTLNTYVEGTLPCTLKTSDVTVQQLGTINYTIVGNVVTLTFPFIYGTSNSSTLKLYCGGLTGDLDPGQNICCDIPYVTNNAVSHNGNVSYIYSAKYFSFSMKDATSFTTSGYKGIGGFLLTNRTTITYIK